MVQDGRKLGISGRMKGRERGRGEGEKRIEEGKGREKIEDLIWAIS